MKIKREQYWSIVSRLMAILVLGFPAPRLHSRIRRRAEVVVQRLSSSHFGVDHDGGGGPMGCAACSPAIWVLPVAFPLVMAFGGMLGLLGVPILGIEYDIAASAILLGAP